MPSSSSISLSKRRFLDAADFSFFSAIPGGINAGRGLSSLGAGIAT